MNWITSFVLGRPDGRASIGPYHWIAAFVSGLFLHIADVMLTIHLLTSENGFIEFYENNSLLADFFTSEQYLTVFVIKCLGWWVIMCAALHPKLKKWVTPTVIWAATAGFAVVVFWNLGWAFFISML